MVLEHYGNWPAWTESPTRTELRAAVADLRHLEAFLGSVGREHRLSSLSSRDTALSQLAVRVAVEVGKLTDRLEHELATGQGRCSESVSRNHRRRWKEGFRETFLVIFTRKGDASALRRLALLLSELYVNAAPRWWPYSKGGELITSWEPLFETSGTYGTCWPG